MFFEDAKTVSKELELTLTGKKLWTGRTGTDVGFRFMPQTDISTGWSKKDTK